MGFPRSQRLTREVDLEALRRRGKRMQTEHLEARVSASLFPYPRVGVVVPKYRRNVVDRNKVRRRLRELARLHILPVVGNLDLLLRAKPEAYLTTFSQLGLEIDVIARWAKSAVQP